MKTWNRFNRASLSIALLAIFSVTAFAQEGQVQNYTTSSNSGTWNEISGGGTMIGYGDDNEYTFPGPAFTFNYDSVDYTANSTMYIQTNGYTGWSPLNNDYNTEYNDGVGEFSYHANAINPFSCDLVTGGQYYEDGPDGGLYYETTGSAPNRVFTIEWSSFETYENSNFTSMEVNLHETSNVIDILFLDHDYYLGQPFDGNGGGTGLNGQTSNAPNDYLRIGSSTQASTPSTDFTLIPPQNKPPGELSLLPKSLNFGSATPNSPVTMCVTASNVGSATIHITGYSLSGSTSYSVVNGPVVGDSILPGNNVQYCIQFLPLSGGSITGNFYLSTDARDSATQSVSLTGFGAVPEVSYGVTNLFRRTDVLLGDTSAVQYVPVNSIGGGPLHFFSIYFIGLNANNYSVVRMPQNPLPPDATDSIGIQFSPTFEGRPDASLVINTDATNMPWDTVSLFGIGALPHLVITVQPPGSGNTVMFDSVAIGDSVCQTLTLTNPGTDTLEILKQLVTYGDYDFTYYPLTGADTTILPGGGSALVNVCFKPLKAGSRLASIRFYTNIPRTFEKPSIDTSQFQINVTGIGVPYGQVAVLGSMNDTAIVGNTNCITDTLKNFGQSDVTISSLSIAPSTANFALTGATLPLTLPAGGMKIISLCFTAQARGTESDTLLVSGSTSEKAVSEALLLNGVGEIACVAADPMIVFGADSMTLVGAMDTSCITVTNCGDIATTYTASLPLGTIYTLVPPLTSTTIPAGGAAQFCVTFQPTAIGPADASVTINGGPTPTTTVLGGVGAGVTASALGGPTAPVGIGTCDTFPVTVSNGGNIAWTPGTGMIGGANMSDFTIVSGPTPAIIPAHGSATMMISFCASVSGTESMTLTFPSEAPVPVAGPFSFSVNAVGTSAGVALTTEEDGFTLGASYPNPTNGSAAITVTLPYDAPVRIDLIDATGALVQNAFTGRLGAGTQTVSIDAKGLPSGTYFYMLSSGDVHLTRQLSLIK